jgi:hypothetical protein
VYDADYPASGVGSGSILLGWALLAEHEPRLCSPYFYVVDWEDQGDVQQATAYGANVLTVPHALDRSCAVEITFDAERSTDVGQWDGAVYHRGATWRASAGFVTRHAPYDPRWPFVYDGTGVLFQFADAFVAGEGIRVAEPRQLLAPSIDSEPALAAEPGEQWSYAPLGSGDAPHWWSLAAGPGDADIDPATGLVEWTPPSPGRYVFTLRLDNDVGQAEQSFVLELAEGGLDESGTADHGTSTTTDASEGPGESTSATAATAGTDVGPGVPEGSPAPTSGCGCRAAAPALAWLPWLVVLLPLRRRRR